MLKSDTESESENEAVKDIPDYLKKKGDYYKEHHSNIKAFLKLYLAEKHTPKDYKLLKGAFTSKRLQNDELKALEIETDYHAKLPSRIKFYKSDISRIEKISMKIENEDQSISPNELVDDSLYKMSGM